MNGFDVHGYILVETWKPRFRHEKPGQPQSQNRFEHKPELILASVGERLFALASTAMRT